MAKYVYFFGDGKAEGSSLMRNLLGGKGCELAEMTNLGIPVPPGFTITTAGVGASTTGSGGRYPDGLWDEIVEHLGKLEAMTQSSFGDGRSPAPGVGALGRARLHARHDGDRPQPRAQRRDRRGSGRPHGKRALRLGLLSTLRHDVRQRGAPHQARGLRGAPGGDQATARRAQRSRGARPTSCARSSRPTRAWWPSARERPFPRIRASSSAWPSTPSSIRGSPRRRWSTGASTVSPPPGARRSP